VVFSSGIAIAESWTPNLTVRQQRELRSLLLKNVNSVFAAAESGAWGTAWSYTSLPEAKSFALSNCRRHLAKGDLDCAILAQNGNLNSQTNFHVDRVSDIYRAVNGKKASRFFDLAPLKYEGDPQFASKQYSQLRQNSMNFENDENLKVLLSNVGLVSNTPTGWGIFLSDTKAFHYSSPRPRKVFKSDFKKWGITKEGLLCMFLGAYDNGSPRSTTCMIIDSIANGVLRYNWAESQGSRMRKGFIVLGNPVLNSVK
jgi:hypothetical protein